MDTLFHFLFPIMAAMAVRVHLKHPVRNILIAAFVSSFVLDLDHFIFLERATFHNLFLTMLLPLLVVFYAFHYRTSLQFKGFSILMLVFLFSHVILDVVFPPGVALLWPLSAEYITIDPSVWVPLSSLFAVEGMVASPLGIALLFYFAAIVVPCYFLNMIITIMEKRHEDFRKALRDIARSWNWKEV
ncbi:MAG TPA: metal-dependent hydrolase [archaeon]|nr:metal-dependent hydrolase [archaeon]